MLNKWVKGDRPAFTLGREQYQGGKWIEITSGTTVPAGEYSLFIDLVTSSE